jgi:hypothetical protein
METGAASLRHRFLPLKAQKHRDKSINNSVFLCLGEPGNLE